VVGRLRAARADVPVAEDLLVAEDAGAGVLAVVVVGPRRRVGGRGCGGGLRRTHCLPFLAYGSVRSSGLLRRPGRAAARGVRAGEGRASARWAHYEGAIVLAGRRRGQDPRG